jgi:FkbM family methyltransferase
MEIATTVYENYLASLGKRTGRIWTFLRHALIKLLGDPTCTFLIHGKHLKMPLSHALPYYLKVHPFYDRLPQRIGKYIHQKQASINCVDVGANIGDTIASFFGDKSDKFLAIEPNPKFYRLLNENWGDNSNVTMISDICSSESSESEFMVQEKNGTASIVPSDTGTRMRAKTLDQILESYPSADQVNILKIDTDGHDFEVIQGSINMLLRCKPMVLFECDVFGDENYVKNCLKSLEIFKQCGYSQFLLYDNFGSLMGRFSLSDLSSFRNLIFYQLTSKFHYFDILVMQDCDISEFYKSEITYFAREMPSESLREMAASVVL